MKDRPFKDILADIKNNYNFYIPPYSTASVLLYDAIDDLEDIE